MWVLGHFFSIEVTSSLIQEINMLYLNTLENAGVSCDRI
jgi:hypothetical protein